RTRGDRRSDREGPPGTESRSPGGVGMTGTAVREKGRLRSALGWVAIAAAVIVFALLIAALSFGAPDSRGALDPESAKDSGTQALAELLRDQGVEITVARTRADAVAAVDENTTLVLADPF